MIWVETPSNPLLKLIDLESVARFAAENQLLSICDNTFASPWIQRPLELGFDLVLHSATKYLNGHSDIVGGVAVVGDRSDLAPIIDRLAFLQNAVGAVAGPFDSFLAMRGLKTLALRMERHCANALSLASWLEQHPKIRLVRYPGTSLSPATRTCRPPNARIRRHDHDSPRLRSCGHADDFWNIRSFSPLAESLGGVESLIEHPALMTHGSIPPEQRAALGIDDTLVRLSVGVEDLEDLRNDLATALEEI